uniref:RRM domain-containing protein n=2 Tax=Kalanchoe fedtschenkoi TaxID=63787 RepID=A0A7N1A139_KALFE
MADGFWNRQPQIPAPGFAKRPRTEYEMPPSGMPSAHETHSYLTRGDDRGGSRFVKDTKAIGSAYDRYLQNQLSSFSAGEVAYNGPANAKPAVGGMSGHLVADHSLLGRYGVISDPPSNGQGNDFGIQHPVDAASKPARGTLPLPPDASNTIYVEGLPSDCTKREVAHIFRPFVGYKEVRLVTKDAKHRGGDPLILCFVDFADAACAATAMSALQGYKMDENDPDSRCIRLQFSRHPGPRSGPGSRGR